MDTARQPLGTSRQGQGFLQEEVSSGDALCSSYSPAWLNLLGLAAMARSWGRLIALGVRREWVRGSGAQGHSNAHLLA